MIAEAFGARKMIYVKDEDGLFTADPKKDSGAQIIPRISLQELLQKDLNDLVVERAVLELTYFSDLSQQQIAQQLGLPLGTVKTRIRGAITKLRHTLVGLRGGAGNGVMKNGTGGPNPARLPGALHRDHE